MITDSSSCRAYCKPVQRTVKSLRLATEVLRREGLVTEIFGAGGRTCQSLRESWNEWTSTQLLKVKVRKRLRLKTALKGFKTLFDEPCEPCDKENAKSAREEWAKRALFDMRESRTEVLSDIKARARWYMGNRWWDETKERKCAYVPDQQGCAEMERGCGGSLSVRPPWIPERGVLGTVIDPLGNLVVNCGTEEVEEGPVSCCRIGVAKKKGKVRVVTMQSARAKRILRPVHRAAYDHLSRQEWLVRGQVTPDHFETIRSDLRPGESFRSGDFEASTDNLNKDAVLAVVSVLAEALPLRRRKVLLATFEDTWVEWKGARRKVVRGSMMGNLLSFVVLCLLNKICLDRARQRVEGCGPVWRKALVNGDDLLFAGSDRLFQAWLEETKEVGFVINLKKTMVSTRYGDLNSCLYDYSQKRVVPVFDFGFLGTDSWKQPEGSLADGVFSLLPKLRFATAAWFLNTHVVQSLFARVAPPVSVFPRRWWQFLVKKRWFRSVMSLPDPVAISSGTERKLPFVLGPPLRESNKKIENDIKKAERIYTRSIVREWWGVWYFKNDAGFMVPITPKVTKIEKRPVVKCRSQKNIKLLRGPPQWRRLWLQPVLELVEELFPELLCYTDPDWLVDQPGLTVHVPLVRRSLRPLSFFPPGEFVPLSKDGATWLSPQD